MICMSVMRALACETHVPTVKLWLMVLNLYLVLSEGHINWQESVGCYQRLKGIGQVIMCSEHELHKSSYFSNYVPSLTNCRFENKSHMCNIRFCIAGEMAFQFF